MSRDLPYLPKTRSMLDPPIGCPLPTFELLGRPSGSRLPPGLAGDPTPEPGFIDVSFGFAVATPGRRAGRLQLPDPYGAPTARCQLAGRRITCG